MGVDQSQYLLSFRDNAKGVLKGFEVDLAREIARDIFGDPERVDFRFVDSSMRTESLVAGQVDIVIRTMSITKERSEAVDFSAPYLDSSVRMLVPTSSHLDGAQDLSDERICVAAGSNTVNIARENFPQHELLRTRTWTDCLMAMQRFQADAIYTDDAILTGLRAQDPYTTLVADAPETSYYSVAISPPGFPKHTTGLVMQVNSTMERIRRDGTWRNLYDTWLADYLGPASSLPIKYRTEEETKELNKIRRREANGNAE